MAAQDQGEARTEIEKAVNPLIKDLPKEKRTAVVTLMQRISRHYTSSLPDAKTVEHYDRVIPNGAERLMQLAEQQAAHRREQESRIIVTDTRLSLQGQWFALTLAILLGAAGWHLGLNGHDWLAGVVFATTIGGVVAMFVLGRKASPESGVLSDRLTSDHQQQSDERSL